MIINAGGGGGQGGMNGGIIVSGETPEGNSTMLWVNPGRGGEAKYWNGSEWVLIKSLAAWG